MNDFTSTLIIAALLLILVFVVPRLRVRAAIPVVIRVFRREKATDEAGAKTREDLRIRPVQRSAQILGGDATVDALSALIDAGVVKIARDGKLYLSETDLANSKWRGK